MSPDPEACFATFGKVVEHRVYEPVHVSPEERKEIVNQLRAEYEGMRTARHYPTFTCGLRLARVGLSQEEIEEELLTIFGDDRNSRRHVASTIKSLQKYGSFG